MILVWTQNTINNQMNNLRLKRYVECKNCKWQILWVRNKKCNRYINEIINEFREGRNQNKGDNHLNILRQEIGRINTILVNSINKKSVIYYIKNI